MKKVILILIISIAGFSSAFINSNASTETNDKKINETIDAWHKAAAEANFDAYFNAMTPDAVFIGTDATENWNLSEFKAYAKPHFERGKAWSFTALERHVFTNEEGDIAWFDELLDTQMKICRGSGVLKKTNGEWKIAHYVLSMTIPNNNVTDVIKLKASAEDSIIRTLKE